jgi:integrase
LKDDVVLDPYMIGRFVTHHLDGPNRASRNPITAHLRRVSEALLGDAAAGMFKKLGTADAVRQNSLTDQASLEGCSRAQTSEEPRTSAAALLALGFVAGLTGSEIIRQPLEDIVTVGDTVTVHVAGGCERDVPLRRDWSAGLLARVALADDVGWAFRTDQRGGKTNLITGFVSRTGPEVPLQTRRMRATWSRTSSSERISRRCWPWLGSGPRKPSTGRCRL